MLQNKISATHRFHASSKSLHRRSSPNIRATENKPHRYNRYANHFARTHIPRKAELDYAISFWLFFDQPCVHLLQGMAAKGECGAGINISQQIRVKPILLSVNIKLATSHRAPQMVRSAGDIPILFSLKVSWHLQTWWIAFGERSKVYAIISVPHHAL